MSASSRKRFLRSGLAALSIALAAAASSPPVDEDATHTAPIASASESEAASEIGSVVASGDEGAPLGATPLAAWQARLPQAPRPDAHPLAPIPVAIEAAVDRSIADPTRRARTRIALARVMAALPASEAPVPDASIAALEAAFGRKGATDRNTAVAVLSFFLEESLRRNPLGDDERARARTQLEIVAQAPGRCIRLFAQSTGRPSIATDAERQLSAMEASLRRLHDRGHLPPIPLSAEAHARLAADIDALVEQERLRASAAVEGSGGDREVIAQSIGQIMTTVGIQSARALAAHLASERFGGRGLPVAIAGWSHSASNFGIQRIAPVAALPRMSAAHAAAPPAIDPPAP
jgi:hypothetical protein